MALQFSSYIYGIDTPSGQTEISAAGGELNSFASSAVHIYPTTAVRGKGGVTCQAIIHVFPTGATHDGWKYYSADSVSTLKTAANA